MKDLVIAITLRNTWLELEGILESLAYDGEKYGDVVSVAVIEEPPLEQLSLEGVGQ